MNDQADSGPAPVHRHELPAGRTSPEGVIAKLSAVNGERLDDTALSNIGEESEGAIEAGLARAVWASDDVHGPESQSDIPEGSISRDREFCDHEPAQRPL